MLETPAGGKRGTFRTKASPHKRTRWRTHGPNRKGRLVTIFRRTFVCCNKLQDGQKGRREDKGEVGSGEGELARPTFDQLPRRDPSRNAFEIKAKKKWQAEKESRGDLKRWCRRNGPSRPGKQYRSGNRSKGRKKGSEIAMSKGGPKERSEIGSWNECYL